MPLTRRFAFFNLCSRQKFGYEEPHEHRSRADPIRPHLSQLYAFAERHGVRVLFTQCVGGSRLPLGASDQASTLMVRHEADSSDWLPQLDAHREIFVERPSYGEPGANRRMRSSDVFHSNASTTALVDKLDVTEWVVFGVAMQVCVASAVHGLLNQGQAVTILSDTVLTANRVSMTVEESLDLMKAEGARIETSEEFLARAGAEMRQHG